jgi:exonuclease SbcC
VEVEAILQKFQQQEAKVEQELQVYATVDQGLQEKEGQKKQTEPGHFLYLKNEQMAQTLAEKEQIYKVLLTQMHQAELAETESLAAFETARKTFKQEEMDTVQQTVNEYRNEIGKHIQLIKSIEQNLIILTQKIQDCAAKLIVLESTRRKLTTQQEAEVRLDYFRKVIKDSAPYILKAVLADISAEANRIFGEIMGERSTILSWDNEYEISLRKQSATRPFALLSGGEQMSAALSVRLALIKKLTRLNLAFFDEPTQNMDEVRRSNLAEQIRRVRGFEQLIVISHDDTFEQGLDSIVRLGKKQGITHLVSEDTATEQERVPLYAS